MFAGVTFNFFVINAAVTTELFLLTRSFLALPAALAMRVRRRAERFAGFLRDPLRRHVTVRERRVDRGDEVDEPAQCLRALRVARRR